MNQAIITSQLSLKLPNGHELLNYAIVDPYNFDEMYELLKTKSPPKIKIYDATHSKNKKPGTLFQIKDHLNLSGHNPLIGRQAFLGIDFIDISKLYHCGDEGVITHCCGTELNTQYDYPSHYLCHLSILARAMGIKSINAFLYNIK